MSDHGSTELPGYEMLRLIGKGGMAEVHLATQLSLGREVALKILSPDVAGDPTLRERFLQEARIAAQLHHPNIIAIHDVGTHDGVAYIAMEYEPGGTVSPKTGVPLDAASALRIVRDIAGALDYAHERGVVHRDVKPDNILRRADGSCLLSDFGIARVIDADTVLTREGTSIGTPQYMSPEQLRGEKLDGRSDLYSLGVVLYQLLTGALPYTGSDGWAIGLQHIGGDIPRLPATLSRLQPLIDELMAKDPAARPKTGAEVQRKIDALGTITAPTAVLPRQPSASAKRPLLYWLGAAALVIVLATLGYTRYIANPTQPPASTPTPAAPTSAAVATHAAARQSIAVLPLRNESGDKEQQYFSDGLSEDLITALAQFDQLKVIGSHSAFQFRDSRDDSKTIGAKLGVAHLLLGSVRRAGDMVRINVELINASDGSALWSQRYDRPYTDLFKLQDEITAAVAGALKARLIDSSLAAVQSDRPRSGRLDAYAAYLQGVFHVQRFSESDQHEAVARFTEATRLDPEYALAHAELSRSLTALASTYSSGAAATALYAQAKAEAERALALDPQLAVAHLARGYRMLSQEFDWRGAELEFREAMRLAPNDRKAQGQLGRVLTIMGRPEEGVPLFEAALESDPLSGGWLLSLASNLMILGRYEEAERHLHRAIELQSGSDGAYGSLALLEIARGNPEAALAVARSMAPGPYRAIAETQALQVVGPTDAADAALARLIKEWGDFAAYQIAEAYALRKDPDQAFAWLERAHANRDPGLLGLLTDPLLRPLKSDKRYAAFVREVGLPDPTIP